MKNTHELLEQAATDAKEAYEYNLNLKPHMRMSRAGYPLVSLLLEDFVIPMLPRIAPPYKTERQQTQYDISRTMAQSTGYLFEQVIKQQLEKTLIVKPQYLVSVASMKGSCDMITIDKEKNLVSVVECKALKYSTKQEATTKALCNDGATSYTSQLALYKEGIRYAFPDYRVEAYWMLWCKASASFFKVPFLFSSEDIVNVIESKVRSYNQFKAYFEARDLSNCVDYLRFDTLPLKEPFFSSFSASCPFHFSPWSNVFLDKEGYPFLDSTEVMTTVLETLFSGDKEAIDKLIELTV